MHRCVFPLHTNDSAARCRGDGLRSDQDVKFRNDVLEVRLHGGFTDEQRTGKLLVALAGRQCSENHELAPVEFGFSSRCPSSAANAGGTAVARPCNSRMQFRMSFLGARSSPQASIDVFLALERGQRMMRAVESMARV